MLDLCIQDLSELTGGSLRLSEMPPLAGCWEPIRRIVFDSRQVRAGDIFWSLPGQRRDGSCYAEDAFLRSALGVVAAGRAIAPWPGGFSLQVADTLEALTKIVQWLLARDSDSKFLNSLDLAAEKADFLRLCCPHVGAIYPPTLVEFAPANAQRRAC